MNRLPAVLAVCLAALAAHPGCVRSVPPSDGGDADTRARIQDWEDRRSLGDGRLVALATGASDEAVRVRALRALARIQDLSTLDAVRAGLSSPSPRVRDEAAFAAGELALSWEPLPDDAKAKLTEALVSAEADGAVPEAHGAVLEALGKLGTPDAVRALTARLSDGRPFLAGRAAKALGVVARRGGAAAVAGVPLARVAALTAPAMPDEARSGGAYLLASARRPEALGALRQCLGDADPEVRALCAKGMGDVGGPEDSATLARLLRGEEAPRVAAEAARSLAKLAAACSGPCTAVDALEALAPRAARVAKGEAAQGHALLAVAQQGLPDFGRPVLVALRSAVAGADGGAASDVARGDLAWLDCRLAAAMDRQRGVLEETPRCGLGRVPEPRRLALGLREVARTQGAGGADFAVAFLKHPNTRVRMAALEAVAERPPAEATEAAGAVRALIASGATGDDAVEAASAAAVAGRLRDARALPAVEALAARVPREPDLAEPVAGALVALQGRDAEPRLREWLKHPHANVRRVAAESLTTVTGQPVRSERVELPPDAFRPPAAPPGAMLRIRTAKGDITVRLDAEEAPLTAGNLFALARKGSFNGVTFHRVVPDFVAQGGDPRGDGEGGPGYSIRCEMTRRPYRRATLGMALSGKDTGGSQFFFTHTPQPHLDGRYTAFGEVVSGMDVVDDLLEGDVMTSVEAVESPR